MRRVVLVAALVCLSGSTLPAQRGRGVPLLPPPPPPPPQFRKVIARKVIARKVIDRMGPSDLAAVVFTRDNRNSQDYTSDRARLRRTRARAP